MPVLFPQDEAQFVDLHAHTLASDGSLTPGELVRLAKETGLAALAITDHDTFDGYEAAVAFAREMGVQIVRGIELNTRLELAGERHSRSAHLLAYWPGGEPGEEFVLWLRSEQEERRSRNRRLIEALQGQGIEVSLAEIEAIGRSLAGRPHFARVLVEKGYARNTEDAFQRFLGETAPTYVERESQTTEEAIRVVRAGGGIPSLAHPIRLTLPREIEAEVIRRLRDAGLVALEIYHSEHTPEMQAHYRQLAEELGLLPTGGSDFHGMAKPTTFLGTGVNGNVRVPRAFLDGLERRVQ